MDIRGPPTAFRLFSRLPQELQNLIWKFAARNEQRVVEVQTLETKRRVQLVSKTGAPNTMFVCQASRTVGLAEYAKLEWKGYNSTYIAWERDVVIHKGPGIINLLNEIKNIED